MEVLEILNKMIKINITKLNEINHREVQMALVLICLFQIWIQEETVQKDEEIRTENNQKDQDFFGFVVNQNQKP